MNIRISKNEMACVKRVAKNVQPLLERIERINTRVDQLMQEKVQIGEEINAYEAGIKARFGCNTSELVKKVVVTSPSGVKTTKYDITDKVVKLENGGYEYVTPEDPEPQVTFNEVAAMEDLKINEDNED